MVGSDAPSREGDTGAARLASVLAPSEHAVAVCGAGISTESGIPDYRSSGGMWTRHDPRDFTFRRYVEDVELRKRSWAMRRDSWAEAPQPNPAHHALVDLEAAGRLAGIITQNVDGLHQAAGSRRVVEVHGNSRTVICIGRPRIGVPDGCGWTAPAAWAFDLIDEGVEDPSCPECGRLVKIATVSFGQALVQDVVDACVQLVRQADLLIVIGSSLQVHPAAGLPRLAVEHGTPLVIVNDQPTPLDHLATVIRGRAGEVLPAAVTAVLGSASSRA